MSLKSWDEVRGQKKWSLLLGNGFSINIDSDFSYTSLLNEAKSDLTTKSYQLFKKFKTKNFEEVLSILDSAKKVAQSFGKQSHYNELDSAENNIRTELINTIKRIHTPFPWFAGNDYLEYIRGELRKFKSIYTTNYDLIPYWAIMTANRGSGFLDFFWHPNSNYFDWSNSDIKNKLNTPIYFLHGGLHIFEDDYKDTHKLVADAQSNILDQVSAKIQSGKNPVFITEGSWENKYRKIKESDYLTFALDSFSNLNSNVVIFGQSLNVTYDNHIVRAIKNWDPVNLAISIHSNSSDVSSEKYRYRSLFSKHNIDFFDSGTHPLGDGRLSLN